MRPAELKTFQIRAQGGIERLKAVVIGAGQAGLSAGYHLARLGIPHAILDAGERIGDSWRRRWDSLRLFTPARYDGLDGMRFPAPASAFPGKDAMADYLAAYAERFALPVRSGVRVDRLTRIGDRYLLAAGGERIEAEHVIVAMANYQAPRVPDFARELDPQILQLHSSGYRNPARLQRGGVLIVGAGNSGAEIAMELAPRHETWMSGPDVGHLPFRTEGFLGRHLLSRLILGLAFNHILTTGTPIGRRVRPRALHRPMPLIRVKPRDLAAAGVERVARTAGVSNGRPVLVTGETLDVANVIWCTGYHPAFSWIELPVFDDKGEPRHERGVVGGEPGLYFLGLQFLYAMSSPMIQGVGRDARYIVEKIAARCRVASGGFVPAADPRRGNPWHAISALGGGD